MALVRQDHWHPKKSRPRYRGVSWLKNPGIGLYHAAFTCCGQTEQPLRKASPLPAQVRMVLGVDLPPFSWSRPSPLDGKHRPGALTEARSGCQGGPKGSVLLAILRSRSCLARGASHQLRGHPWFVYKMNSGAALAESFGFGGPTKCACIKPS